MEKTSANIIRGFLNKVTKKTKDAPKFLPKANVPESIRSGVKNVGALKDIDHSKVWSGYRSQSMRAGGPDSLVMFLPNLIAGKMLGHGKVQKAMWKHVGAPALKADTAAGQVLSKTPIVGKTLFTTKEKIPWGKGMFKEVERSSALAPLTKLRDVAEPIAVGYGLEKGMRTLSDLRKNRKDHDSMNQELAEKAASAMRHLHEENKGHKKRAHAMKLIYKQAELGFSHLPQTLDELETKIASLINQDLAVVEKALELTSGSVKLGELDTYDPKAGMTATEQFRAALFGDDQ